MIKTHSFQQARQAPPKDAETHPADLFQVATVVPSKYAAGADVTTYHQTCPSCAAQVDITHGDRIICKCGLIMELYGNGLTIWRE